jgi:UDP-N-acetylglucosamine--N-acetylmuramyl-(pentapeptide) pyrophosphoryl-undecaprenol N-acetylglucosamine transferase
MGIPTWIHEAEIHPGLANKLLGIFANKVSVAFASTKMPMSRELIHTGHPVRAELAGIAAMPIPQQPRQILIVGGSQGARAIDEAFVALAPAMRSLGVVIRHQTREENCQRLTEAYATAGVEATVQPFIADMPEAFRWCDIVVSRAGAGAISELAVVNRPAVLVPYPYAQGGHQRSNAAVLVDAGKALMVEEGEGFAAQLLSALRELLNPAVYSSMRQIAPNLLSLDAASKIAAGILELRR